MTTITAKQRQAVLAAVLEDTFAPLVAEFKDRVHTNFSMRHKAEYPQFVALAAVESNRRFLKYLHEYPIVMQGAGYAGVQCMSWPSYGESTYISSEGIIRSSLENMAWVYCAGESFYFGFKPVISDDHRDEYLLLCARRQAVYNDVVSVVKECKTRENFEQAHPDWAKHLPARRTFKRKE